MENQLASAEDIMTEHENEQENEHADENNLFEGWTTVEDAAEMVERTPSLLRYWISQGFIKAYPVGKKVKLVKIADVIEYAQKRRTNNNENRVWKKKQCDKAPDSMIGITFTLTLKNETLDSAIFDSFVDSE